jgi:esterase
MHLDYNKIGNSGSNILILHGLFGNKGNWQSIARHLSTNHQVYTLDLRNHGNSPHANEMSYCAMTDDVIGFIEQHNLSTISLIGHSMGGKVAMYLALNYPQLIKRLVIVDIAPVNYSHDFNDIFNGLFNVPLTEIKSRKEAEKYLIEKIDDNGTRQFLLQNLCLGKNHWRFNLPILKQSISKIVAFPAIDKEKKFTAQTLFLGGQESNYINDDNRKDIKHFFPEAQIVKIKAAGHWLHAEKPKIVKNILSAFLK